MRVVIAHSLDTARKRGTHFRGLFRRKPDLRGAAKRTQYAGRSESWQFVRGGRA